MPGAHKRANETLKTPMPGAQNLRYPNRRTDTAHLVLSIEDRRGTCSLSPSRDRLAGVLLRPHPSRLDDVGEHPAPTRLLWTDAAEAAGWPEITLGWLRDTMVNGEALGKHYVHTYLALPGGAASAGVAPGVAPSMRRNSVLLCPPIHVARKSLAVLRKLRHQKKNRRA